MMDLFKLIPGVLDGILKQIMSVANKIIDQIVNPLNGLVQQVLGGVWKGDGATRFTEEMTQQVVPMLSSLFTVSFNFTNSINQAVQALAQAVNQANQPINALIDEFNQIFPG
jgi:uncharacterized protein YukE